MCCIVSIPKMFYRLRSVIVFIMKQVENYSVDRCNASIVTTIKLLGGLMEKNMISMRIMDPASASTDFETHQSNVSKNGSSSSSAEIVTSFLYL